jgi:SAM-dependent methyltransferase
MRERWNAGQNATDAYRRQVADLVRPGMSILHAGCGWDRNEITRPWRDRCRIVGVDLDERVAQKFHSEFHRCSLDAMPFGDASFDLVVSEYVWEHLDNPDGAFREIARVLKPGGRLVVLTPCKWSYKGIAAWLMPFRIHIWMGNIRYGKGHDPDMYPTRYRCNTQAAFRKFSELRGLAIEDSVVSRLKTLSTLRTARHGSSGFPWSSNFFIFIT